MLVEGRGVLALVNLVGGGVLIGGLAAYGSGVVLHFLAGWRVRWSEWTTHGSMVGGWLMILFLAIDAISG